MRRSLQRQLSFRLLSRKAGARGGSRTPTGLALWILSPQSSEAPSYTIGKHRQEYNHFPSSLIAPRDRRLRLLHDGSGTDLTQRLGLGNQVELKPPATIFLPCAD